MKGIYFPGTYFQGPKALNELPRLLLDLCSKPIFIIGKRPKIALDQRLPDENWTQYYSKSNLLFEVFEKQCTLQERDRVLEIARRNCCDGVVGVGGGTCIDLAKSVGAQLRAPVVIVPTLASTDAATSRCSVLSTENGPLYEYHSANPAIILVDSTLITNAPPRFLASGIGDALTTYYEAKCVQLASKTNCNGTRVSVTALAIARQCFDTIMKYGVSALKACELNQVTTEFEDVVEAVILMSGIGFESCGLAAAHSLNNAFFAFPHKTKGSHGEVVTFGLLAQCFLYSLPEEENATLFEFCRKIGLPVTLSSIGYDTNNAEDVSILKQIAQKALDSPQPLSFLTPFTADAVYASLLAANSYGEALLFSCQ
eukprot:GCRY01004236.1.p1 GENE.GCRY01004236.1~~GCRY01004236.1.p1  ORF type:complete len:370 (-),score=27.43 GCRY01004236.1:948-2057(-)